MPEPETPQEDFEAIKKVSDITLDFCIGYLRIDDADSAQKILINTMLEAAKGYLTSYTGLEVKREEDGDVEVPVLDDYPEVVMAVLVLVQNHYDNRTFYVDKAQPEKVVESIINLHDGNLL